MISVPYWVLGTVGAIFTSVLGLVGWSLKMHFDSLRDEVKALRGALRDVELQLAALSGRLGVNHKLPED